MVEKKEYESALNYLVKRGYLKVTKEGFYADSDRTQQLLQEGKTREQIKKILDREFKEDD